MTRFNSGAATFIVSNDATGRHYPPRINHRVVLVVAVANYSKAVFGTSRLPQRAIVCVGAYFPDRKDVVRRNFDEWGRIHGIPWIRFSVSKAFGQEFAVLFGVYGAATTLETFQLLRTGGVRSMLLVGSMYAKRLPVGSIVIPTQVDDMAGIVRIDDPNAGPATPDEQVLEQMRHELSNRGIKFTEGMTSSTPAVLHGIDHISRAVRRNRKVIGVEMETSTFLHFARKHDVRAGALLYVSDNERHSIISSGKTLRAARLDGLRIASGVAVSVLQNF